MNFGLSGATLLKAGNRPYWTTTQFTDSHDFGPNIVVIMLGTNDSKPQNWSHKAEFVADYEELIESYLMLASAPQIFLNLPPPAGTNGFSISGTVIEEEILPLVEQVAATKNATVIDVFTAFGGHDFDPALFGSPEDQVHPNGAGAQVIADTVFQALTMPPVNSGGAGGDGGAAGGSGGLAGAAGSAGGNTAGASGAASAGASSVAGAGGTAGHTTGGAGTGGAMPTSSAGTSPASAGAAGGSAVASGTPVSEAGSCGVALVPHSTINRALAAWLILIGALLVARRRQ
jgi:hypothetical protein